MENSDQLYTIADIAREFSLPESTCRYYCKRFAPYIPSVGEGRRRRFRKETMSVIETIVEEMKKSRTCTAVEDLLAARFPRTTVVVRSTAKNELLEKKAELDSVQTNALDQETSARPFAEQSFPPLALEYMERQTVALEGIAKILSVLASNVCSLALPARDDNTVSDLQKEMRNLRLLLDENEKNQQSDLEQIRTWMGRLIRRVSSRTTSTAAM